MDSLTKLLWEHKKKLAASFSVPVIFALESYSTGMRVYVTEKLSSVTNSTHEHKGGICASFELSLKRSLCNIMQNDF